MAFEPDPARASARRSKGRVVLLVVVAVAVAAAVGAFIRFTVRTQLDQSVERSAVLVVARQGVGGVMDDQGLDSWLSGRQTVPVDMTLAAACHALLAHVGDRNLNADIVVSTRTDLIRAAELVSGSVVDDELAAAVEEQMFELQEGLDDDPTVVSPARRVDGGDVDEYLALRAALPSAASSRRFVVYAVNWTSSVQRLVVVDLDSFRWPDSGRVPSGYEG